MVQDTSFDPNRRMDDRPRRSWFDRVPNWLLWTVGAFIVVGLLAIYLGSSMLKDADKPTSAQEFQKKTGGAQVQQRQRTEEDIAAETERRMFKTAKIKELEANLVEARREIESLKKTANRSAAVVIPKTSVSVRSSSIVDPKQQLQAGHKAESPMEDPDTLAAAWARIKQKKP